MKILKQNKFKKVFSYILPIIFAGFFGYGVYSFYYEFKSLNNIVNIILNLFLMLASFTAFFVYYLKNKEKSKKQIITSSIIADLLLIAFSAGLPYLINMLFENNEWVFSVELSLEAVVFATTFLFLSYYIKSIKSILRLIKIVLSAFVAELSFKSVMSLVMIIAMAISSLTLKADDNLNFKEQESMKKETRQFAAFEPSENDIYVDAANENGNGTRKAPFNNLVSAKEKAKKLRKQGVKDDITVWIGEGEYVFEETLAFDETDADNVVYCAMPNENVEFTGAKAVKGFREDKQNGVKVFVADIPKGIKFDSVVKDGKTLPKTRYPESGYLTVETEDHTNALWTEENKKWEYNLGDTEFIGSSQYNPKEIKNIDNVCVRVLHYWVTDFAYLKSYDSDSNKYILSNPTTMTIKAGDRYYFENIFEELNKSGEWYFDSEDSKLYYVPFENETADDTVLYVCVNDKLIDINSTENIEFNGIEFKNTNFTYPETFDELNFFCEEKIKAPQAEIDVEGAVEVKNTSGIKFTNCDFTNIGNTALKFNKLVKNSDVTGCLFENIGGTGIFINGYNSQNGAEITENINIIDNRIKSYGKNWMSAIGILQTNARNCTIKNNEISDGYYTAISVGWVWGYDYNVTYNNKIQDNLIYDIGQGWLSDMGGIYTLGTQKGTVLSGNVIYNVAADSGQGGYGGWGIYLDEGSSYIEVKNNLVYNCGSDSFHQHYGKDNIITNNIFALSKESQIRVTRNEDHNELHLQGNIILSNGCPIYKLTEQGKFTDDGNIYWDLKYGDFVFSSYSEGMQIADRTYVKDLKEIGYFNNAVCENPQFKNPENGDFTIAENNKAIEKIGFMPWDYTKAGTISDFS